MTEPAVRARLRLTRDTFDLDVALDVPARGITGILGRSGCGKTTVLRCIAGLEPACTGSVVARGTVWQDDRRFAPADRRAVGFVFQDARLFPHLSVAANLRYGLQRATAGAVTLDEVVALLGLGALLARKPASLSAGERQRAAIGRALLRNPDVVLMDEPLANLDPQRRHEILPFLERLHGALTVPIVYVSHSVDEVSRLCDHLVILDAGRVQRAGALHDVLGDAEIAGALGEEAGSVVDGEVAGFDAADELTQIRTAAGTMLVTGRHGDPGARVRLRIQARDVSVALARPTDTTILNILPAVVESVTPRAAGQVDLLLKVGAGRLLSRISRRSCDTLGLRPGTACHAQIKGAAVKGSRAP